MKKPLLVTSLLVISGLATFAQDKTSFRPSTFIKVNPTTLINELDIYVQQELTQKLSLELGISGIYTDYPDYVFAKKIDIGQKKPDISTEQFVDARGLGLRAGLRWYLFPPKDGLFHAVGTYFQPMLFYKKVFYPNEEVTLNNTKYNESGDKSVYGLQLLLGRQIQKDKLVLDPFIGIGIRTKVYRYQNFGMNNGTVQANDGKLVSILPTLQLGIKIGFKM
ncbi:hypothetical protein SAMN05518672_1011560 [Chitinophaga sp. CF118]|uniref:hypothetical protein n=1 Tax=Chitinophaga sp. CF118 TaxID=1884367 RepID=UPI0008DF0EA1|nr:hypothetical protein [Chitinophaga sp. CF118]SFD30972.1 hypothetical protein SAMN05518672_1011560 [Chitinophaga sp. CF118]